MGWLIEYRRLKVNIWAVYTRHYTLQMTIIDRVPAYTCGKWNDTVYITNFRGDAFATPISYASPPKLLL